MVPKSRWDTEPVFLIGGGPSAGASELGDLRHQGIVVVVNESGRLLPWADVLFTADFTWVRRRTAVIQQFAGMVVIAIPPGRPVRYPNVGGRQVVYVERRGDYNSGLEALYWVAHQGARHVTLLGFDLQRPAYWHGGYPWRNRLRTWATFQTWLPHFVVAAQEMTELGITVMNANAQSAIRAFPFCDPPYPKLPPLSERR